MTEKKYRQALKDAEKQLKGGLITKEEYASLIELAQRRLMKTTRRER